MIAIMVMAIIAIAIVTFYALVEPDSGIMPRCLFKMATGWDCPGCGSQRLIHALIHGDIARAWKFNPFMFFAAPVVILIFIAEIIGPGAPRLHRLMTSTLLIAALLTATLIWTILRNLIW